MMLLPFSLVCFYANNTAEMIFFFGGGSDINSRAGSISLASPIPRRSNRMSSDLTVEVKVCTHALTHHTVYQLCDTK